MIAPGVSPEVSAVGMEPSPGGTADNSPSLPKKRKTRFDGDQTCSIPTIPLFAPLDPRCNI